MSCRDSLDLAKSGQDLTGTAGYSGERQRSEKVEVICQLDQARQRALKPHRVDLRWHLMATSTTEINEREQIQTITEIESKF